MRKFLHSLTTKLTPRDLPAWVGARTWHWHRRAVAGSVAIGLFCGLVPGPLQMLSAALLAVWWRQNVPLAMFVTLYTNPLTIVPLYWLAYQLGAGVSGDTAHAHCVLLTWSWQDGWAGLWHWGLALGKPLLLGLPLLASGLAVLGYVVVRLAWRVGVVWQWRARQRRRAKTLRRS